MMTDEAIFVLMKPTKRNVIIVASVTTVSGLFLAPFIARGIIKILQKLATQMKEGAEQVAVVVRQVSLPANPHRKAHPIRSGFKTSNRVQSYGGTGRSTADARRKCPWGKYIAYFED